MSIEFIPAKDLPVLEAESPDVLAVDPATGEMGRVPGANLGGSSGAYIIDLTGLWDGMSSTVTEISEVSFDDFAEHWYNGGALRVKVLSQGVPAIMECLVTTYVPAELGGGNALFMVVVNAFDMVMTSIVFTNGTWTPPAE